MTAIERKQQLKQQIRVIVSVAVSFVLVAVLIQSYRRQRETDQRLAEMEKTLRDASAAHAQSARDSNAPIILDGEPAESEVARKQHNLEEIAKVGWKLVDEHSPDQAAKAVSVFKEGIANVDPSSPELYNGLGRALLVAGKPREAIAAWRKGLALAPRFSEMQSGIGWAYWSLNDPYRAQNAWQKALTVNPHSIDAWSAMAWIDLALGRNIEAKSGFQELVKFDSGRKPWVMGLSMAQGHNNDIEEISRRFPLPALSAFERPLQVDPASMPDPVTSRPL
jgi:tetratricopeptide (TPR) repeat protein